MTEPSIYPPPGGRLLPLSRQYHSTPQSPKHQRQNSDDLITRLSPMNAIDTLRAPSGPLKSCMDAATPSEQSFALRAAVASKNIYEWLDELRDWPWPTEGGLGFQAPSSTQGELQSRGRAGSTVDLASEDGAATSKQVYNGSLLESEMTRYETRITEIQQELDKLEIEDIKRHVLHNHIMPLSRPGTPASPSFDRHFGMPSLSSYVKMDDLTAVITATVVQALPNLSRLLRLMNAWSARLTVLRRVPLWISFLANAETALKSAWATIEQGSKSHAQEPLPEQSPEAEKPSQHNYEVTKLSLEKKVAIAARSLDYMLDNLEGRDDTLPDEWLDRMEAVERECAEWTAAYEKRLRDDEMAALQKQAEADRAENAATDAEPEEPATPGPIIRVDHPDGSESQDFGDDGLDDPDRPRPSVENYDALSRSPVNSITNDRGSTRSTTSPAADESALSIDDLDADHLSLDTGAHAPGSENHRPGTAVSDASTVVRAQPRDPSMTPDPLPVNSSRTSPHTPPRETRSTSMPVGDMPPVLEYPEDEESSEDNSLGSSFNSNAEELGSPIVLSQANGEDDHMRKQISQILENIPAKIQLSSRPTINHLNPPDLQLPYSKPRPTADRTVRSKSSIESKVEVKDIPRSTSALSTRRPSASPSIRPSPPSRPGSALDSTSPIYVKKKRQPSGGEDLLGPRLPATPLAYGSQRASEPPSSGSGSTGRSRSSSRLSWDEEDSSLGMAGPRGMRKDIPQESLDWVESIKEKVRAVSGGSAAPPRDQGNGNGKFGELGRVGGTKRLFRKPT
ncbi:hypothetical protein INS49_014796 [Diaporthe citri]|uniref:uncharacterized protein n=1 Tax=Diaporthe citri TaxID=83186 RepID=UPI001C7FDAB4|nr:uncharacterized protein INS49_014796 [Diaporthe citri]KAG6356921.1 hypothetical protein INS49_014796 [Diaporthe citri]